MPVEVINKSISRSVEPRKILTFLFCIYSKNRGVLVQTSSSTRTLWLLRSTIYQNSCWRQVVVVSQIVCFQNIVDLWIEKDRSCRPLSIEYSNVLVWQREHSLDSLWWIDYPYCFVACSAALTTSSHRKQFKSLFVHTQGTANHSTSPCCWHTTSNFWVDRSRSSHVRWQCFLFAAPAPPNSWTRTRTHSELREEPSYTLWCYTPTQKEFVCLTVLTLQQCCPIFHNFPFYEDYCFDTF